MKGYLAGYSSGLRKALLSQAFAEEFAAGGSQTSCSSNQPRCRNWRHRPRPAGSLRSEEALVGTSKAEV